MCTDVPEAVRIMFKTVEILILHAGREELLKARLLHALLTSAPYVSNYL